MAIETTGRRFASISLFLATWPSASTRRRNWIAWARFLGRYARVTLSRPVPSRRSFPFRVELVLADPDHGANHQTEPLLVDPVRGTDCGKHLGGVPPGLHPRGQVDLLGGGEEADFGDVVQVQPDRIVGEDLVPAPPDPAWFSSLVFGRLPWDLEDLDALLTKVLLDVGEEGLDLFGAEVFCGKSLDKLSGGDEAALPALRRDGLHGLVETGRLVPPFICVEASIWAAAHYLSNSNRRPHMLGGSLNVGDTLLSAQLPQAARAVPSQRFS